MTDEKTYVFTPDSGKSDTGLMAAMMNGCGGMNGMWNNPIWAIVFLAALGRGGLFGNEGCNNSNSNTDFVSSQLGNAINGNANALSNLSTHLDCSIGQVLTALNSMLSAISNVGNSVGMTGQLIINAVSSGNSSLANLIQQCCCGVTNAITTQGYEARLSNLELTNVLGGKIDNQTTVIIDKFCELEKRELGNKIDALRERNTQLENSISNANQTAQIQNYIASVVNPLITDVAAIKAAQPATITVPSNNGVYIPSCTATLLGLNNGFNNGSLWA